MAPSVMFDLRQVTSFNNVEKEQVRATLAAAFETDKFTNVVTNHDHEFFGDFWYSTVIAGLLGGEVYVAEDRDTKNIIGAAVWFPPGREMYDTEEQQKEALSILMGRFSDELREWWIQEFLPRYDSFVTSALGEGTKLKAWHLQTIGVHPKFQRNGIATALIDTVKKKVRSDRSALCLEAEKQTNVTIYERLGFVSKDKSLFQGIPGAGKFIMWAMIQETAAEL